MGTTKDTSVAFRVNYDGLACHLERGGEEMINDNLKYSWLVYATETAKSIGRVGQLALKKT